MPVIVTRYDIKDNPNLKSLGDFAFGLDLPLQMGESTFVKNYDYIMQLKANVTNLLRTNKGERLNQPLFGTDLQKILFEQFDNEIEDKIYNAINNAVRIWVPELSVVSVDVNQTNELKDSNRLEVKVKFNVNSQNASFTTAFSMNSNK